MLPFIDSYLGFFIKILLVILIVEIINFAFYAYDTMVSPVKYYTRDIQEMVHNFCFGVSFIIFVIFIAQLFLLGIVLPIYLI